MNIFITYIVPCYNVEMYLPRCLESLAKQSIADGSGIEYVLVNDGSTDGTQGVLERFATSDNRAILINQKNQGVSAARNTGIRNAHGEYVYFLDGDDFLTDDASQIIYDASEGGADIIITNAYSVRESNLEKRKLWDTCPGLLPGIYTDRQFVVKVKMLPISFKTYRRDLLLQHGIFYDEDLKVGEVLCFFIHSLAYSRRIAFSDGRIMNYLIRNGSVMREYVIKRDINIIDTVHRMDEYADLYDYDIREKQSYALSLYMIANVFSVMKYLNVPNTDESVRNFWKKVVEDGVYRSALKEIISKGGLFSRRTLNPSMLYHLPPSCSYGILRMKSRMGACMRAILKRKRS